VVDFFRGRKWDLVGYRKVWFAISLLVILTGMSFWRVRGLNYGIDFTGGGLVTYQLKEGVAAGEEIETLARARKAVETTGVDARLQIAGTATRRDQLLVRTRVVSQEGKSDSDIVEEQQREILRALAGAFPGIEEVATETVTPVVSKELIHNAIWAVAWGCLFILFWIRLRYLDFKWAGSALFALAHDVLVLVGAFAITQKEINSPFVAAALTVVGYSVHDTIVLFDRIRENLRLRKGDTFGETANISLLETMARSVNTVVTVLFVLIAVYLLGGVSLRNFTFGLIVGITAGGYSSIFNAAQILAVLKNREERATERRRAAGGRPAREPRTRPGPARARRRPPPATAPAQAPESEKPVEAAGSSEAEQQPGAPDRKRAAKRTSRAARKKLKAARKRKKRF
jgi:preprotein translocase subunit SecF